MPRQRFVSKRDGNWKTRKQEFIASKKNMGGVRLNKRQLNALRELTKPNQTFRSHKGNAQGNFVAGSISGDQKTTQFGEKNKYGRIHEAVIDDSEAGIITVSEYEESSRYTPSKTVDVFQHDNGGKILITKVNPKDKRIVSKTQINITPSTEKTASIYDKIEKYKAGEKLQVRRDLIPIADFLGIKGTGAPTEEKLKRKINKKLGITEPQRKKGITKTLQIGR